MNDYANRISFSHKKDILVFVPNGGNQRTHIPCIVAHVGAKNTGLTGTESREETLERGSGNAIDSRYIAFFIRSLQGLWTFWTHDNYLRRWTHCSDLIGTHFVFTSDFQTISHKCVQFKNINCLKKSLVAGTNSCLQSLYPDGLNVRDTEKSQHLPHYWPELIFAKQE